MFYSFFPLNLLSFSKRKLWRYNIQWHSRQLCAFNHRWMWCSGVHKYLAIYCMPRFFKKMNSQILHIKCFYKFIINSLIYKIVLFFFTKYCILVRVEVHATWCEVRIDYGRNVDLSYGTIHTRSNQGKIIISQATYPTTAWGECETPPRQ